MASTSPDAIIILAPSNDLYVKGVQQYDMLFATTCNIQSMCFGYSNIYMKISSNGNVGIGMSNPSSLLDVAGAVNISGDLNFNGILKKNGSAYYASQWYNNLSNIFILSSNIGIGISNPSAVLDVAGTTNFRSNMKILGATTLSNTLNVSSLTTLSNGLTIYNNGTTILSNAVNIYGTTTLSNTLIVYSNVGIGTNTPAVALDIAGTLNIRSNMNILGTINSNNSQQFIIGANAIFNKNVGIGTTTPIFNLDVTGSARINTSNTGGILFGNLTSSNASANGIVQIAGVDSSKAGLSIITTNSVTQPVVTFHNPNGQIGNITLNASTTSYNTSSDYRLKTNIESLTNIWETFIQLNPVTFNFKSDLNIQVQGFIAHEVQDIVPLAVSGTKDAIDEDGNPIYQGIDASKLIPLLVAAVKDLKTELLKKNKLLEDHIEILEKNYIKISRENLNSDSI